MNKDRRKAIAALIVELEALQGKREDILGQIDTLIDEEQEYYDNMPESFQNGEKGSAAEAARDALQNAYDELESFDFGTVINYLDEATA